MKELKLFEFQIGSDEKSGVIGFRDFYNQTHIQYVETREKAFRDELIKLGWMPPGTKEKIKECIRVLDAVDEFPFQPENEDWSLSDCYLATSNMAVRLKSELEQFLQDNKINLD